MAPKRKPASTGSSKQSTRRPPQQGTEGMTPREQAAHENTELLKIRRAYQSRPIVAERLMAVEPPFEEYIRTKGWLKFANGPMSDGARSLVHEFYYSLHNDRRNTVTVHGKAVDISPAAINAFFELPAVRNDEFTAFFNSEFDVQAVMRELTGRQRNIMPNWAQIPKAWLVPKARLLNQFVSARLMPISCHSSVARRRALLIYAISTGMTINVGQVINLEMHATTEPTKSNQAIGFPSLITTLCWKVGIFGLDEPQEKIKLMRQLKLKDFSKGPANEEPEDGDEQEPLGGDDEPVAPEQPERTAHRIAQPEQAGPSKAPSSSEESSSEDEEIDWPAEFDELNEKLDFLKRNQKQLIAEQAQFRKETAERWQQSIAEQAQFRKEAAERWQYQLAFNTWLATGQQGPPPTFPLPPPAPAQGPSTS